MTRERHVRICERLGVKFPGPTRPEEYHWAREDPCSSHVGGKHPKGDARERAIAGKLGHQIPHGYNPDSQPRGRPTAHGSQLEPAGGNSRAVTQSGRPMKIPRWLALSIVVPILWGTWGALIDIPEKRIHPPFPAPLGYIVWSLTMIPCALIALQKANWRLDRNFRSVLYGCLVGFSGALGQLILFGVLTEGPAYIVFPIICLSPVVTIVLSLIILRERVAAPGAAGIVLAIAAIFLLSLQKPADGPIHGHAWLFWSITIFFMWGLQAYFMKSSAATLSSEGLFFYMAVTAIVLTPLALYLTDFSAPINWGLSGLGLTAAIQTLNAVGALLVIYAIRAGKAIIVVPMINGLFPLVTIALSLAIYRVFPNRANFIGIIVAVIAIFLMALSEVRPAATRGAPSSEPAGQALVGIKRFPTVELRAKRRAPATTATRKKSG
jgi:uncharacterized membrane protein